MNCNNTIFTPAFNLGYCCKNPFANNCGCGCGVILIGGCNCGCGCGRDNNWGHNNCWRPCPRPRRGDCCFANGARLCN